MKDPFRGGGGLDTEFIVVLWSTHAHSLSLSLSLRRVKRIVDHWYNYFTPSLLMTVLRSVLYTCLYVCTVGMINHLLAMLWVVGNGIVLLRLWRHCLSLSISLVVLAINTYIRTYTYTGNLLANENGTVVWNQMFVHTTHTHSKCVIPQQLQPKINGKIVFLLFDFICTLWQAD